jgi:hypothetical protein
MDKELSPIQKNELEEVLQKGLMLPFHGADSIHDDYHGHVDLDGQHFKIFAEFKNFGGKNNRLKITHIQGWVGKEYGEAMLASNPSEEGTYQEYCIPTPEKEYGYRNVRLVPLDNGYAFDVARKGVETDCDEAIFIIDDFE